MNNILEKCKKTRILAVIGVIGLILGTILPYIKITIFGITLSESLFSHWAGKILLLLAIAIFLFIFKDVVEQLVPAIFNNNFMKKIQEWNSSKCTLILTVIIAIIAIYIASQFETNSFEYYNIGFYSLWIGIISMIAYSILHKNDVSSKTNS